MEEILREEIPNDVKLEIVNRKLQVWNNTLYDAGLDAQVAAVTKDPRQEKASQDRVKSALQAIDFLTKQKKELEKE